MLGRFLPGRGAGGGEDSSTAVSHRRGRSAFDQILNRASATLSGDHGWAVPYERTFVDEIGDVLPGGAPPDGPPLFDRLGPRRIEPQHETRLHFGQVRTNPSKILLVHCGGCASQDNPWLDRGDRRTGHHCRAGSDQHSGHSAVARRFDGVVHLHRFDHHQLLSGGDVVAWSHIDGDDRALHRCFDVRLAHSSDGSWRDRIRLLL